MTVGGFQNVSFQDVLASEPRSPCFVRSCEAREDDAKQRTLANELDWIRQSPKARQAKSKARISAYEELLESQGLKNYLVEVGGELRGSGSKPYGQPWRVAVERPIAGVREVEQVVVLKDMAVATSDVGYGMLT